ncbi:hypothetical protein GCM10009557_24110 [Virgisporangium ochraceum]|uniref:DUF1877 domain-containing protein n=1 Tax=Virgisporangium ochraceum TaxID=65505 RepID=A0A8J4EE46_9ACTN|nr:hypothetical protein [Virgisporangium ochraceum]GIJ71364.1 hypothetical protein Voc01_062810 [Virgisporangium ochraceum]
MSMVYHLAKITPGFAVEVRARPELVRDLFYGDGALPRSDFKKKTDTIDGNWIHLGRLASTFAQPVEFVAQDTWLSKAVNGSGADDLGVTLGYGPVWAATPHRVAEIAQGVRAESAALPAEPSAFDDDESAFFYGAEVYKIYRFYLAAARQGRTVVGAVL